MSNLKKVSIPRLYLIVGLYSIVANFAHPITPTFIQSLKLHDYMFGVAFACMSTTNFLFSPFWGKVSRNFGSMKIMGICFFGYSLAQLIFGFSTTELGIILARLFGGFFISSISVNQILYIMDNAPIEHRSQDLANIVIINTVLAAFGYMCGGFLGDISIRLTFILQALGLASIGLLCFVIIADSKETKTDLSIAEVIKDSNPLKVIFDARGVISLIVIIYLTTALMTTFASTSYEQAFNYFIRDQYGFPPSYNGLLKACVGIITLVFNMTICKYLLKKTDIKKTIIPILFICFMMMISIIVLNDVIPFIVMNVVFFGFNAIYQPLLQALINNFKKDNGTMVGLYNALKSLGNVIGSLTAGFVYGIHPKMAFILSAIAFMIAIILATLFYKKTKNNEFN